MSNIIKLQSDRVLTASKVIRPRIVERAESEQQTVDPSIIEKANEIIKQAEKEASRISDQAALDAEQLRNSIQEEKNLWEEEKAKLKAAAWDEGYQVGLEEGRTAGKSEYESLIETAVAAIDKAKLDSQTYIVKSERIILELAMACTESILGTVLAEEPEKFIGIVQKALNELKNEKEVEIFVHPSQFDLVVSSRNVLESAFPREAQCYIYPNEELSENDCVIECETIRIDAGIDSQLTQLKESLAELLAGEQLQ